MHAYEQVGEGGAAARCISPLLPALRDAGLRHGLPDRRVLQAAVGRHRAGRRGHVHRLQAVQLGLPLRCTRVRHGCGRDEEMHALRRPHLQRQHRAGGPRAGLRRRLPASSARHFGDLGDPDPASRSWWRSVGGVDLMPELGYNPTNKYLPPRPRRRSFGCTGAPAALAPASPSPQGLLGWLDRLLSQ